MHVGLVLPIGITGEFADWEPTRAWTRTVAVAQKAEALGFESLWLWDHFYVVPGPTHALTFESFSALSALAVLTTRVRLGHVVACAAFRNPALTAKMISTMDVMSGGRMELGLGAGWIEREWWSFGYGFPPARERVEILSDHLEVITQMLGRGSANFVGDHATASEALNLPRGLQTPRIPIVVGGNGPNATWRLAARHADELNVDSMLPSEVAAVLPVIRARCVEIGRDPSSLRVSVHLGKDHTAATGQPRVDLLGAYRDLGLARVVAFLGGAAEGDDALESFAEDVRDAGLELAAPPA